MWNQRIISCSTTSISVGCSRPTLCIVLFYERINKELCCWLHYIEVIKSISFSLKHYFRLLCLFQSVSSFHLIRHVNKFASRRTLLRVESTVYSKKENVLQSTSRLHVSSEHSDSRRMSSKRACMQSTSKRIHDDER